MILAVTQAMTNFHHCCHPERSEGSACAVVSALAFLVVIPEGNLLFSLSVPWSPVSGRSQ